MSISLFGLSLPPRIDPETGGWASASDDTKLRENLIHVLSTAAGERPMRRAFGGGVRGLLHDPNGAVLHSLVRYQIANAIATWEPRVDLRELRVEPDPAQPQSGVLISVTYVVRATLELGQMSVPVSLGSTQ